MSWFHRKLVGISGYGQEFRCRTERRALESLVVVGIAVCLGVLVGCAHSAREIEARRTARILGARTWHELRAERFTLLSDGSPPALEAYARDLARFIAVVDAVVNAPPPNVPARFVLLSRETQDLFLASWVNGFIRPALPGFHSFVRADDHSPVDRHTLLHEFTHYLTLRNNSIAYPHWYVEGIAEFLGSTRARDDTMEVGSAPPGRIAELERQRARGREFELSHVLEYDPRVRAEESVLDYASAWALVHYLNTSDERKRQLSRLLELQIAGRSWQDAFSSTFSESPQELAAEIDRHARRISRGAPDSLFLLDLDGLDVDSEWTIRELTRTEADVELGEVLILYEAHPFAEAVFRDAIDQSPGDLRARTGLIEAVAAQSRFGVAQELIAEIDLSSLSESESLDHLASALYLEAESVEASASDQAKSERRALYERAERLFEQSTRRNPRSPVAWAGLARCRLARGDALGAVVAFERASATGQSDADLMLDWGSAERGLGQQEAARSRWDVVLRIGDREQRARATRLIAELSDVRDDQRAQ